MQTVPDIAAKIFKTTGAVGFWDLFDKHRSLLAILTVGRMIQYLFTNIQVNISPAASADGDGEVMISAVGS